MPVKKGLYAVRSGLKDNYQLFIKFTLINLRKDCQARLLYITNRTCCMS